MMPLPSNSPKIEGCKLNVERSTPNRRSHRIEHPALATLFSFLISTTLCCAATPTPSPAQSPLPDLGFSAVRVFGALILVLALFLGGVWLFKNWQRVAVYKGRPPKLNVLEVKSLGSRHALYLVAYEQQRLLISSSPAGINLITHLPEAGEEAAGMAAPVPTFAQSLRQVLAPKS